MLKYGSAWQLSNKLAVDLKQWLLDHADETSTVFSAFAFAHLLNLHLETEDELLCAFCVEKVEHLSNARVVRVRLQPSITAEGKSFNSNRSGSRFHQYTCPSTGNGVRCKATLLVPQTSVALPEATAILGGEHTHQRVSNRFSNSRM